MTSSAGIIQPWIRGCRGANSGREITAVNCITNHQGLSVFHFSICQQFFFSHLHLQSSWLLIKRTLTHLHRLNRKTCTTFFFFFFFLVPFAKICDRFIHRQRQRFSPTFVFFVAHYQSTTVTTANSWLIALWKQQKLSNNKSLWRKACSTTQEDGNATWFRFKSYVRQVLLSVLVCSGLCKKKKNTWLGFKLWFGLK